MKKPAFSYNNKKFEYEINYFEKTALIESFSVCGIDEVGRGPLFGNLRVSCVVLKNWPPQEIFLGDSKKITKKNRTKAFNWIVDNSFFHSVGIDPWLIDKINVNRATEFAINKLLHDFEQKYHFKPKTVLVDHVKLSKLFQHNIITAPCGEDWSISIAAASILGKVKRDLEVERIANWFPLDFDLAKNVGYGTSRHIRNIEKYGVTILHRVSYCKNILNHGGKHV